MGSVIITLIVIIKILIIIIMKIAAGIHLANDLVLHFLMLKAMPGGSCLTTHHPALMSSTRYLITPNGLGGVEWRAALLPQFPYLLEGEKVLCSVGGESPSSL